MQFGDAQIGIPAVIYKDTKANIIAFPALTDGMFAYATDTSQIGVYIASTTSWKWIDAQVQADWNESTNTKLDYIKNKPSIPAAQIQADWSEVSPSALDYIKNKPTIASTVDNQIETLYFYGGV